MPTPTIVVGYDGSPASHLAVERAIDRVDHGKLIIVHAYRIPVEDMGVAYYEQMLLAASEQAAATIDDLEQRFPRLSGVDFEASAVAGPPGDVICRVARHRHADEIVMGSRGLARVRALLGSVAHDVLSEATCPVLIIPERMVAARREATDTQAVA